MFQFRPFQNWWVEVKNELLYENTFHHASWLIHLKHILVIYASFKDFY